MTTEKKTIDWEAVEREYRIGIKSNRELGAEFGCTEGAIRKRAKAQKWVHDLSAKVRQRAEDLVRTEEVRTAVRNSKEYANADREKVEISAQIQATVQIEHRRDIKRGRELMMKLLGEVEFHTDNPALFERLLGLADAGTEDGEAMKGMLADLEAARLKVLNLPGRIDSMKKLSETMKNLVSMERQAFGMDEANKPGNDPLSEFLNRCSGRGLAVAQDE